MKNLAFIAALFIATISLSVENCQAQNGSIKMDVDVSGFGTTSGTTTVHTTDNHVSGTAAPGKCAFPMSAGDFNAARASVESKTFDTARLPMSKQIAESNCLTAAQVRDLAKLLTHDSNKLEFAMYAYDRSYDRGNYFKVHDAFTFDGNSKKLTAYIQSR